MGSRLYVGNLPYKTTDEELTELFGKAGAVDNVRVMRDMATGRARGFAFVEMASDEDAQKAISEFHEHQIEGRALVSMKHGRKLRVAVVVSGGVLIKSLILAVVVVENLAGSGSSLAFYVFIFEFWVHTIQKEWCVSGTRASFSLVF